LTLTQLIGKTGQLIPDLLKCRVKLGQLVPNL